MENKVAYISVGIFVFFILFASAGFALWYTNYAEDKTYKYYKVNTSESVAGLNEKAPVKLMGVNVGEVNELFVNPNNSEEVSIIIKVEGETPIKQDSFATLKPQGITGLTYLEIEGNKHKSPLLKTSKNLQNMGVIQTKPSLLSRVDTSFASVVAKLEITLDEITKMSQNTNKLLNEKNLSSVEKLLKNTALVSKNLEKESQNFSKVMHDLSITSHELKNISKDELQTMLKSVTTAAKSVEKLMKKFDKKADNGQYDFKIMLSQSLQSFEKSMHQLNDVLNNLEQNPSDLLFKTTKQNPGPGE